MNVTIRAPRAASIVGAPRVTITYTGSAPSADARVLAQVLDASTGKVLGNQITPLPVTLDGRSRTLVLPLELVAAAARRGSRFTLQLVAQSTIYDTHAAGGSVHFTKIHFSLPTAKR